MHGLTILRKMNGWFVNPLNTLTCSTLLETGELKILFTLSHSFELRYGRYYAVYGGQNSSSGISDCNAPTPQYPSDLCWIFDSSAWFKRNANNVVKPPKVVKNAGAMVPDGEALYFFNWGGYNYQASPTCDTYDNDMWCRTMYTSSKK